MSWFRRQRHEHDWDRWRVMLTSLSAPWDEPVREARHCRTCPKFETRPKDGSPMSDFNSTSAPCGPIMPSEFNSTSAPTITGPYLPQRTNAMTPARTMTRPDATLDQLRTLIDLANARHLHDAEQWLRERVEAAEERMGVRRP